VTYVLAKWRWDPDGAGGVGCWRAPQGCVNVVDLRTGSQASSLDAQGVGLFVAGDDAIPKDGMIVGDKLDGPTDLDAWREGLGFDGTFDATSIRRARRRVLLADADPAAIDRVGPLLPGHDGKVDLFGEILTFAALQPDEQAIIRTYIQGHYRAVREQTLEGQASKADLYSRVLDDWRVKLAMTGRQAVDLLIPIDLPREDPLDRQSMWDDTFDEGSDVSIASHTSTGTNGGQSWALLAGAITVRGANDDAVSTTTGSQVIARLNADVSSIDHYVQAKCQVFTNRSVALLGRKDSSGTLTFVMMDADQTTSAVDLYKCESGTYTSLGTVSQAFSSGVYYTNRLTCNGTVYTASFGGSLVLTVTNPSPAPTANGLRGGLRGFASSGLAAWDDFVLEDIAVTGHARRKVNGARLVSKVGGGLVG
jgi:hypothetical protein